jgi:parallel beta-helix repeat protein
MISYKIKLTDAGALKLSQVTVVLSVVLFFTTSTHASTYYFSSRNGNDGYTSNQAQNFKTPWKSIDKLNSYFKYLSAGDSVLFQSGEVFYGSIIANKSGAVFAPICFGAYGKGPKPEITGLTTLNNWKLTKPGIYQSPCLSNGQSLVLNNEHQALGRFPNQDYLSFESHNSNNSITDNQLSDAINWTGAEIVIRKTRWLIDRSKIIKHSGGTIIFAGGHENVAENGYGYFIQKNINTLDQYGEWYFDSLKRVMMVYFGDQSPYNLKVQTGSVNYLVDIQKFNNLKFEDISFTGAGKSAFNIAQSNAIVIKNCDISLSGFNGITASYSPFLTVQHSTINQSLSGGINLDAGCTNASIIDNHIKNTGLFAGMGGSGAGTYEAITSFGDNTNIETNRIDSTGYNGIYFGGNSSQAKNNYIRYFCLIKDDGAGIYIGDWSKTSNKKVTGNIILHGVGNSAGTKRRSSLQAEGIYIDDNSAGVTVSDNTVSQCSNNGIKIHNAKNIGIYNNTVFNNGVQLRLEQDHYIATSDYIRNNTIRNNTFFAVNENQTSAKFSTNQDDIPSCGEIDSNIYCRPANIVNARSNGVQIDNNNRSANNILFEYNASNKVKTVMLNSNYTDIQNRNYADKIDIGPYSSVILIASNLHAGSGLQHIEHVAVVHNTYQK